MICAMQQLVVTALSYQYRLERGTINDADHGGSSFFEDTTGRMLF